MQWNYKSQLPPLPLYSEFTRGGERPPPRPTMSLPNLSSYDNFSMDLYDIDSTLISDLFNNITTNITLVDVFMQELALTLNVFYTPFLIVIGCYGNLATIIVFIKSKLRLQSTSQYLSALAVSDTLFLCQLIPPWLKAVGASTVFSQNGYCQLFVYLSYVTSNFSSWLVVAFTVERFVAVVYPLRRNAMCTVRRARYIIATLAVCALLVNLPVLRFAVPNANDCNIDQRLMVPAARFNAVDTVISFTLPLTLIMILNSLITADVCQTGRNRGYLLRQRRHCRPHARPAGRSPRANRILRSQQRVTKMLLIVSSVFVLLNLPAYSMRIAAYANDMDHYEYSGKWAALQQICLLFFNTNFGINFYIYCLSGQNFRRALLETFPSLRRIHLAIAAWRNNPIEQPARASSVSTASFVQSFSNNHEAAPGGAINNGASSGGVVRAKTGRTGAAAPGTRPAIEQLHEENEVGRGANETGRFSTSCMRQECQAGMVIHRWRFDNSRQARIESFELEKMPAGNI